MALLFGGLLAASSVLHAQTETPDATAPVAIKPAPPKTLTNASIIRMATSNLSDDLIIQAITSQPGQYTTDADALIDLKDAGVSERVINAMLNKNRKRLTPDGQAVPANQAANDPPPPPPVVLAPVNEIGAYYKDRKGVWQPL
jgi:hypothetical protein